MDPRKIEKIGESVVIRSIYLTNINNRTFGIDTTVLRMKLNGRTFLNVWDFAGQEVRSTMEDYY